MTDDDDDIAKAMHFYLVQKVFILEIKKKLLGAFDIFEIYPDFGTKLLKLSRSINDFALYMGCLGSPNGEFDNSAGCLRIRLQRRDVGRLLLTEALNIHEEYPGYISPLAMGCTAFGTPLVVDQASVPNTLVAGSPGAGKSTLLRVMVENFLASKTAVLIIDPKMIDFIMFKNRKGCTIETDNAKISIALSEATDRMNGRYMLLAKSGKSSISEYNSSLTRSQKKIMPEVIIIDEWADVLLSNKKNLEKILLLSQKGRAAGISLILATQRPSSGIFPGQIKANFSGRIAMRVSSEMESRIIINSSDAANISEPGMAYYMDAAHQKPILFRVADYNLPMPASKSSRSFWSNIIENILL